MRMKFCRESDLKEGEVKTLRVLARNIALFRVNGELHAIEADCKHMRASIAHGRREGKIITCPAHGWRYDITTGECLNEPWAKLKTFVVELEGGDVYVTLF